MLEGSLRRDFGTPEGKNPMPLLFILVALMTLAIAVLCYVWMTNSRASQTRMEQQYQKMVSLLEEQNAILRSQSRTDDR